MNPARTPLEPTPYSVKHENCIYHGDYYVCEVPESKGLPDREQQNRAYATHIVRAVNSHQAMRDALQYALDELGPWIPISDPSGWRREAKAALALANEQASGAAS